LFILGEIVRRRVIVEESAGRCDFGTLVLHDEPDDEGADYTENDKAPHNDSRNGARVRTSSTISI